MGGEGCGEEGGGWGEGLMRDTGRVHVYRCMGKCNKMSWKLAIEIRDSLGNIHVSMF